jgi:5,10-methenyltetrahydrofolate synthetase
MTAKSDMRRQAMALRRDLISPGFAQRLAGYASALALPEGAAVSGYAAMGDEADPKALLMALSALGHPIALPRMTGKAQALCFHRWQEGDALRAHAFGVLEPLETAPQIEPDIVLVPLLAFDRAGYRLGYGGGFYDRTLAALRAQKPVKAIGIAYAGQETAAVPHDDHDQRLDGVLTEDGFTVFA